jgi:hypothetical protein
MNTRAFFKLLLAAPLLTLSKAFGRRKPAGRFIMEFKHAALPYYDTDRLVFLIKQDAGFWPMATTLRQLDYVPESEEIST